MATTDADSPLFLDTNVLIYASVREPPEHHLVNKFVEQHLKKGTILYISRQILREYLAVLSRHQSFTTPMSKEILLIWLAAWRDRCRVLDDTAPVMDILWGLFYQIPFGGKQVHDANIVATMLSHGLDTLVTVNIPDFNRFKPRIKLIDPRVI
jgi:predicted nucleic acid-binding protein